MKLTKPWDIQLELTFGCDNRCSFCFKQVNNKERNDYQYMSINTAHILAQKLQEVGWDNLKIEYTLRGEPTLNPNWIKITKIFRNLLPKSQITVYTNGNNLNPSKAKDFFKAGGNIILMDCYHNNFEKRMETYSSFPIYDYYSNDFNPFYKHPPSTKSICLVKDIAKYNSQKKTRIIDNRGGNIDYSKAKKFNITPLTHSLSKKCTKPFRDITILYDGTLVLCCLDAEPNCIFDNIRNIPNIKEWFFKDKKLNLARLFLYNKKRIILPCKECDFNGGMRQGFLPKMKSLNDDEINKYVKYFERI